MTNLMWDFTIEPSFYNIHLNKRHFQRDKDKSEKWVLFIVEKGSFYYNINNKSGIAKVGDMVVCPPNCMLHREVVSTLTIHHVILSWETETVGLDEIKTEQFIPNYIVNFKDINRLLVLLSQLRQISAKPIHSRMIWIKHLLNHIWYQYAMEQSVLSNENKLQKMDPLMYKVKHYIIENAFTNLKIKHIAKELYITPVQLSRRFKSTYGLTPMAYVRSLRMDKVKSLLIETDCTIEKIATLCGYENGFYLSRVFTKNMGVTPSEYRRSHVI